MKKIKLKHIIIKQAKLKLPKDISPCPFCGCGKLFGWVHYPDTKNPESFDYKHNGRYPQITCSDCGIGVEPGYFGNGISDKEMVKMVVDSWNRRAK
jgi:predicted nucleic-acid-binding Zn-ribbon protein